MRSNSLTGLSQDSKKTKAIITWPCNGSDSRVWDRHQLRHIYGWRSGENSSHYELTAKGALRGSNSTRGKTTSKRGWGAFTNLCIRHQILQMQDRYCISRQVVGNRIDQGPLMRRGGGGVKPSIGLRRLHHPKPWKLRTVCHPTLWVYYCL